VLGLSAESDGERSVVVGESTNSRGAYATAVGQGSEAPTGGLALGRGCSVFTNQGARIGSGGTANGTPTQLAIPVGDTYADADLNLGEVAIRADDVANPSQIEFRMKDTNGNLHTFTAT
jgi:hypothetical protein